MSAGGVYGAQRATGQALARAQPECECCYVRDWLQVLNLTGHGGSGLVKKLAETCEEKKGKRGMG